MKDFLEVMEEGERLTPNAGSAARAIENFDEKFASFLSLITNSRKYAKHKRAYLMKEAETTSDFPILFGTVLERSLLGNYTIAKPDWRAYVKVGTQNDFRVSNLIGIRGLESNLSQVAEREEYKQKTLKEGKVQNQVFKYGRAFGVSWETFINDDLGALNDLSSRLSNAALRTEYFQATKLIVSSSGPNAALFGSALVHPIDGVTINNKGALPFNADNLAATITAMQNQVDIDGEPIVFDGFHLVFGPALQIAVLKVLNPASLIATGVPTGSVALTTSANVVATLNIKPHMNPYIPIIDTTGNKAYSWYVIGDLSNGAAVQMNFLRGHETPEIVQKASDKVTPSGGSVSPTEGDFETDTYKMRVRHILGGTQIDPRLAYAQVANALG